MLVEPANNINEGSPPTRWSGLKVPVIPVCCIRAIVSTYAVEWIERIVHRRLSTANASPPTRWSGLKAARCPGITLSRWSPPTRWSGLKDLDGINITEVEVSPPTRWSGLKDGD